MLERRAIGHGEMAKMMVKLPGIFREGVHYLETLLRWSAGIRRGRTILEENPENALILRVAPLELGSDRT